MDRQEATLSVLENQWLNWKSIPSTPPEAIGGIASGTDHFGIFGDNLENVWAMICEKSDLRSLTLVSSKCNFLFSPLLVRTVILRPKQIPSFLLLLKNRPGIGDHVRDLRFHYPTEAEEEEEAGGSRFFQLHHAMAKEIIQVQHPTFVQYLAWHPELNLETNKKDYSKILRVISVARSVIISECTNLTDFVIHSGLAIDTFPFTLDRKTLKPIFSDKIRRFLMIERADTRENNNLSFNGSQVFFLLQHLKHLKWASFEFQVSLRDALMFRDCLDELMEKNLYESRVEYLHLIIGPIFKKRKFDSTETFTKFFKIFKNLKDFSVEFRLPENYVPVSPHNLLSNKIELPEYPILNGLKSSIPTLKSLSIVGMTDITVQRDGTMQAFNINLEAIFTIRKFKNLLHLRSDSTFLVQLIMGSVTATHQDGGGSILPDSLETLDLAGNWEISNVSHDFRPLELSIAHMVDRLNFPPTLKIIRSYKHPTTTFNARLGRGQEWFSSQEFCDAREQFSEAFDGKNLKLELIERDEEAFTIVDEDDEFDD